MFMVLLIWALQLGALAYLTLQDASLASFLRRLKEVLTHRGVWMLAAGCFAFLYAGGNAIESRDVVGGTLAAVSFLLESVMLVGLVLRLLFRRSGNGRDLVFGSAEFATPEHAVAHGLIGETGIRLGTLRSALLVGASPLPLHYTGQRHLATFAPTRAGKGVSTIIPNLLTYPGSMIVVDPKGENAMAPHARRAKVGKALVLDPWGITGKPVARFNPLDLLQPDSPTLVEDATLIAEALVIHETDGNAAHFSDQAADTVKGFLLYQTVTPGEVKTLGRLREILTSPPSEITKIAIAMSKSTHPVVAAAAAQIVGKNDKEWMSIISTAQRNTHFLDSPALRANLAVSISSSRS